MTGMSARPILTVALFAAAAALAGCGQGETSLQKGLEEGLKAQFVESFEGSCRSATDGVGVLTDKVVEVCKCAADQLVKKFSASELASLSPDSVAPVMKSCAAKSGLSN